MIYLTEAYAIDNNSILRILTQNKQINRSDPNYSYYAKLATWANENGRQQKLKNIDLNALSLSDKGLVEKRKLTTRYTTLGHLLNDLKNLMDQEGKYTPSSEISKLVQQTTLDILTQLSKPKVADTPEEEPDNKEPENENGSESENKADEPELYEGIDWTAEKARRLEAAEGEPSEILDKFYDDYYSVEYAGKTKNSAGDSSIVAKLKSLDKILIQEFNALGYNPAVNPLAQFLKILISLRAENNIFDKLNTNNYGAIHNAFKNKYITGNMLGNYDGSNILFCNDLYNYKGPDIVDYLSLQDQVLDKAEDNVKYSDDTVLIAKIFIQQQVSSKDYAELLNKLFYEPDAGLNITLPGSSTAKLKSELEVRELYRHLFKAVPKKAVNTKVAEEICERAKKADAVLSMVRYILDQNEFANSRAYAEFAQDTEKWLEKLQYTKNDTKIAVSKKILADYVLNASAENLIVRHLREYTNEVIAKESEKAAGN
jgi:hypothetical protein